MEINIEYFPTDWVGKLETALSKNNGTIVELINKSDSYCKILVEIPSMFDFFLTGYDAGLTDAKNAMDEALPIIEKNVQDLINSITIQTLN